MTYSSFDLMWFLNLRSFSEFLNSLLSFKWLTLFSIIWFKFWPVFLCYFLSIISSSEAYGGSSQSKVVSSIEDGYRDKSLKYLFLILTYFSFFGFFSFFLTSKSKSLRSLSKFSELFLSDSSWPFNFFPKSIEIYSSAYREKISYICC